MASPWGNALWLSKGERDSGSSSAMVRLQSSLVPVLAFKVKFLNIALAASLSPTPQLGILEVFLSHFFFLPRQEVTEHLPSTRLCSGGDEYRVLSTFFSNTTLWEQLSVALKLGWATAVLRRSLLPLDSVGVCLDSRGFSRSESSSNLSSEAFRRVGRSSPIRYPAEGRHKMFLRVTENQFTLFPAAKKLS